MTDPGSRYARPSDGPPPNSARPTRPNARPTVVGNGRERPAAPPRPNRGRWVPGDEAA